MVSADSNDNVPRFVRPTLDLVYQAAEIFGKMEDRAREVEARAETMRRSTAEKLKHAEKRIEAAERARREIATEADSRLQDASKALKRAQASLEDAEDRLTAMEFRAQLAEAEAREAKKALALIEEAIRKRLLYPHPEAESAPGESLTVAKATRAETGIGTRLSHISGGDCG